MNYYYEVKLNFLDKYYQFYEWGHQDKIKNVHKIPVFYVSFGTFVDIMQYAIKVNSEFLSKIKNKTSIKNGNLNYACIFTDENNSLAVLFNSDGKSVFYSSLMPNDELNLREISYNFKKYNLDYKKIVKLGKYKELRNNEFIKNYLIDEINNLYNKKNIDKLKFIYNEIFSDRENNINYIIDKLIFKINNDLDDSILNVYNLIKLSYKNV